MKLSKKFAIAIAASAMMGSLGLACSASTASTTIVAGGATFPINLMESCRATFAGDSTANSNGDKVDYTGVGSSTGRANFYKNTYDFAMSDSLYKTTDTGYRSSFVFMPLVAGAIDVAYRLDGIKPEGTVLQMSSATVAKIFAGQITNWKNAAISADNPETVVIPDTPITVYKRKEGSGTTHSFANYLNKVEPSIWTKATNDAFDSAFPGTVPTDGSFVAAQGNDGVANGVMGKNGGIGYAEVSFVNERQSSGKSITAAKLKNGAGEYLAGSSAAAALFVSTAAVDSMTGIVEFNYATTKAGAYPITAVSYGMANTAANGTAAKNEVVKNYVNYVLDTCAPAVAEIKGYAALPANIVAISKTIAAKIGA